MENDLLTSELKGHRTLATVVFTDCVGFSARMSVDEDHTLDLIRRDLKLMKQVCDEYEGRVLKSTGDGLLMCFISAVKAVEYAIEIQKRLIEKAANRPPQDSLQHRIGIHLADIFINETDVMGNGVNIAARLQTLAEPGGICISQTVYDVVKAGMQLETRYLGPQELKNIREVVPTYKIILDPTAESADPYIETIRSLEQNRNFTRIKKLLVYVCKNTWEGDANQLARIDLRELLNELLRLAPTPERLQQALEAAVKTLSKPAEYSLVASIVVEELSKLCFNLQQQAQFGHSASQPVTDAIAPLTPVASNPNPLYERVARELEQTGNLLRIKKLIYYVCRKRWENDPNQLDNLHLPDLVAELHQRLPRPELLRTTLNEFIQTLSKQGEYTLVGNAIASKFQQLYATSATADQTQANQPPPTSLDETALLATDAATESRPESRVDDPYHQIAAQLEQDPNSSRMKKLILYVCRRRWESDSIALQRVDLRTLLQELYQLTHTREQLELALNAVAQSLNKREEYAAIARTIVRQMGRLYPDYHEPEPEPEAPPASTSSQPEVAPTPVAEVGATSHPKETEDLETPEDATPPIDPATIETPFDNPQKTFTSLFDYRLGIMKYANPLRAKILLFSALHGDFGYSNQDWLNLKMHELDGLMRQVIKNCKFYTELEALLYGTARRLREPEENVETATAVIRCLRSLYLYRSSNQEIDNPTEETRISLDDFEETTLEIAHASDEDELTCQLLIQPPTEQHSEKANQGATE
ncbi:adenylate/guanylate cyclase domain-containing protein [Leptothermofonsia sp. ETS-13]|uniref:adenylate/guanylate cyclase domain-containing protein n=1 Tax=Leptothermofonsia sp. ETS-13 TaxID=3035696 RepID=UPI003B9F2C3A